MISNDLKKFIKINSSNVAFAPASYRGRIELGIEIITSEEKLSGSGLSIDNGLVYRPSTLIVELTGKLTETRNALSQINIIFKERGSIRLDGIDLFISYFKINLTEGP